jgi:hypothetical protein
MVFAIVAVGVAVVDERRQVEVFVGYRLHRVDAAIAACDEALALDSSHAEAANNLGIALKARAAFPAALGAFERAAELGSEEAHVNLGTTRLMLGDYRKGWPQYGWVSAERRANPAFASLPMWDGTPFPGQRLLIWPQQDIGDTIQMARFLRRTRGLGGSVTLACPPGTLDLLRTIEGVDAFIAAGESMRGLTPSTFGCPRSGCRSSSTLPSSQFRLSRIYAPTRDESSTFARDSKPLDNCALDSRLVRKPWLCME